MTEEEWEELRQLGMTHGRGLSKRGRELLDKTAKEDEHPENYDGPCECYLCRSYGD